MVSRLRATCLCLAVLLGAVSAGPAASATFSVFSRFDVGGFDNLSGFDALFADARYGGHSFVSGAWSVAGKSAQIEADGDYESVAQFATHRAFWADYFPANESVSLDFDYKVRLKAGNQVVASHTFRWNVSTEVAQNGTPGLLRVDLGGDRSFAFDWGGNSYIYELWGASNGQSLNRALAGAGSGQSVYDYDDFDRSGHSYWRYVNDSCSWVLGGVSTAVSDPVPEPSSLLLLAGGVVLGLGMARRRRRRLSE